jgi:hypothetical protein
METPTKSLFIVSEEEDNDNDFSYENDDDIDIDIDVSTITTTPNVFRFKFSSDFIFELNLKTLNCIPYRSLILLVLYSHSRAAHSPLKLSVK